MSNIKTKINNNRVYYNTIQGNRNKDKIKENRINNNAKSKLL